MAATTFRKYKPRASARPDPRAEALSLAAYWKGCLERAVAGTTRSLLHHPPVGRTPIPEGPFVDLVRAYLNAAAESADAKTIENHAKYAIA